MTKISLSQATFKAALEALGGSAELRDIAEATSTAESVARQVMDALAKKGGAVKTEGVNSEAYALAEPGRPEGEVLLEHAGAARGISHDSPWYAGPYDCDRSEGEVRADFSLQFGRHPERTIHTGGGWLVGPLTDEEVKRGEVG